MPTVLTFNQVDVFAQRPLEGNPLAVVTNADALSDQQMAAFARWTNLSETTFLLRPTTPEADYRVRIFTPTRELPFAGHPTLGSCHVWLANGGVLRGSQIIQECGAGLVRVRRDGTRLAFAAPPLLRDGVLEDEHVQRIAQGLNLAPDAIVASQWVDNGPGWVAVLLRTREEVLAIRPNYPALGGMSVGVAAPWNGPEADADIEVRALISSRSVEDSATGSLNASLAPWLIPAGLMPKHYVVSQGTVIGHRGRLHVDMIDDTIWVGGEVQGCIAGHVTL
jgi:PhzF family phenazine biosynthesis protein